jgi:hypothetical protein
MIFLSQRDNNLKINNLIEKFGTRVIGGLTSRKHKEYWQSIHGQRQSKDVHKIPSAKRAGE